MEDAPDPLAAAGEDADVLRSVGNAFVDAFNRPDVGDLVRLCEPDVEWYPAPLSRGHEGYHWHDGLARWVGDLDRSGLDHRIDVLDVTPLNPRRFMLAGRVRVALE